MLRRPHFSPPQVAAIRRGVAAVVPPDAHSCPRCSARFIPRLIPGALNLSSRDVELIDTARELTLKEVTAAGWRPQSSFFAWIESLFSDDTPGHEAR